MNTRFVAFVHSIIDGRLMLSATGNVGDQYAAHVDHFDSMISAQQPGMFHFRVKEDYLRVKQYARWLKNEEAERKQLDRIEAFVESINNEVQDRLANPVHVVNTEAPKMTESQMLHERIWNPPMPPASELDEGGVNIEEILRRATEIA